MPNVMGVTSIKTMRGRFPRSTRVAVRFAAWIAAPHATASSGLILLHSCYSARLWVVCSSNLPAI